MSLVIEAMILKRRAPNAAKRPFRMRGGFAYSKPLKVVALAIGLLGSGPVMAQSIRGAMGLQSRASIGISVSVMPRFQVALSEDSNVANPASAGLLQVRSTAGLRYAFVSSVAPAANPVSAPSLGGRGVMLVVIVPD